MQSASQPQPGTKRASPSRARMDDVLTSEDDIAYVVLVHHMIEFHDLLPLARIDSRLVEHGLAFLPACGQMARAIDASLVLNRLNDLSGIDARIAKQIEAHFVYPLRSASEAPAHE